MKTLIVIAVLILAINLSWLLVRPTPSPAWVPAPVTTTPTPVSYITLNGHTTPVFYDCGDAEAWSWANKLRSAIC